MLGKLLAGGALVLLERLSRRRNSRPAQVVPWSAWDYEEEPDAMYVGDEAHRILSRAKVHPTSFMEQGAALWLPDPDIYVAAAAWGVPPQSYYEPDEWMTADFHVAVAEAHRGKRRYGWDIIRAAHEGALEYLEWRAEEFPETPIAIEVLAVHDATKHMLARMGYRQEGARRFRFYPEGAPRENGRVVPLGELAEVRTSMDEADFWLIRRGKSAGKPFRIGREPYRHEDIGVRVVQTDLLLPDYLFYVFEYLHMRKALPRYGTLFDHIRVRDVRRLGLRMAE